MYVLDTNVCIDYMRKGRKAGLIDAKFLQYGVRNIKLPAVVVAELLYGAYHSKSIEKNLKETISLIANFEVFSFGAAEADAYGRIRASLERKGKVISDNDMFIAATALVRNAVLVTNNTREFSRIDGLRLDDWTI
ncbi:MAG: type II toxin-antitoxin system VapC family toxin [Synergistaceae bacterium]|nr:type II toxin-antitoxin system VapC family toxin [Synergistaceae bacterium]